METWTLRSEPAIQALNQGIDNVLGRMVVREEIQLAIDGEHADVVERRCCGAERSDVRQQTIIAREHFHDVVCCDAEGRRTWEVCSR